MAPTFPSPPTQGPRPPLNWTTVTVVLAIVLAVLVVMLVVAYKVTR